MSDFPPPPPASSSEPWSGGTGGGYPPPPSGWSGAPYAQWIERVGASLIDGLIVVGLYIPVFIVAAIFGAISEPLGGLVAILGYLAVFGFAIWQLVVQGQTGQTIGKKTIGIKLLKMETGQPVGPGLSIARQIVHVVDSFCFIGYLWPLWDEKRQTFADKILTTVVVKA